MPHVVPLIHLSHDFRRQIFHISVLVVAGPDAGHAASTAPTTTEGTANRIPCTTGLDFDDARSVEQAVDASVAHAVAAMPLQPCGALDPCPIALTLLVPPARALPPRLRQASHYGRSWDCPTTRRTHRARLLAAAALRTPASGTGAAGPLSRRSSHSSSPGGASKEGAARCVSSMYIMEVCSNTVTTYGTHSHACELGPCMHNTGIRVDRSTCRTSPTPHTPPDDADSVTGD